MNKKDDEVWGNTGWAFATINRKLAEFFFNKKSKKIIAHCYVKLEEFKTKREQKMIRDDTAKYKFTWKKGVYKQISVTHNMKPKKPKD